MAEQQLDPQLDDLRQFDSPKETENKLPVGWLILFFGLIAWGALVPVDVHPGARRVVAGAGPRGRRADGVNLLATIAFTAIPTTAAVVLILAQRRKGKKQAR